MFTQCDLIKMIVIYDYIITNIGYITEYGYGFISYGILLHIYIYIFIYIARAYMSYVGYISGPSTFQL